MTSDRDDYYRRQARDAEHQAQRAVSPVDRAAWLRLAHQWLSLVDRKPAQTEADAFDDLVQSLGTGRLWGGEIDKAPINISCDVRDPITGGGMSG